MSQGTTFESFAERAAVIGECRRHADGQEWVDAWKSSSTVGGAANIVEELCRLRGTGGEQSDRQAFADGACFAITCWTFRPATRAGARHSATAER
eukprot:5282760-Pyramimonas_sp.AAC.1